MEAIKEMLQQADKDVDKIIDFIENEKIELAYLDYMIVQLKAKLQILTNQR